MRRHLLSTMLMLAATWASASDGTPGDSVVQRPSRYYLSFRSAILPCNTCELDGKMAGLLSTVHGIKLNKTFGIGVGAGLTSAGNVWLVPVFGNLRMNFPVKANRKNKVFLEMNYGWGLAPKQRQEFEGGSTQTTECKSYIQPSIGYSIGYHDLRIAIMVGMQSVKLNERSEYPGYFNAWGLTSSTILAPTVSEFEYAASRMLIGVSIGWRD